MTIFNFFMILLLSIYSLLLNYIMKSFSSIYSFFYFITYLHKSTSYSRRAFNFSSLYIVLFPPINLSYEVFISSVF